MRPSESEDFFLFSFLREAKALRIASEKGELVIFTAPTQWLLQQTSDMVDGCMKA